MTRGRDSAGVLPGRRFRRAGAALVAAVLVGAGACARQGSPTGGQDDRRPPVIIQVTPDTFALVEPGLRDLQVEFNERISEQTQGGSLDDAVVIAPEVGELRVKHRRSGLEISIPEGLQPGVAYTVRILPVVRDMFGNAMAGPFEWAISTGGAFSRNAVVGSVWDRATGDPLDGARVVLVPSEPEAAGDTLRYAALTDREGLYALRILPEGPFRVLAFQDRNRNDSVDFIEPSGESQGVLGAADTLFLSLPVLTGDSTPAVLAQMEVVDSQVVRLLFDDLLDPTLPVDSLRVDLIRDTVSTESAGTEAGELPPEAPAEAVAAAPADTAVVVPGVARRFHEYAWAAYRDSVLAEADSLFALRLEQLTEAGDTLAADSLRGVGRPPLPGEEDRGWQEEGFGRFADSLPDGTPVPTGSVVLVLQAPLPPEVPVRVILSGAVNLNGLQGGGGEVTGSWVPPVDSAAVSDSAAAADTVGVPADTAGVAVPRWR